jgi:hypothetical protein
LQGDQYANQNGYRSPDDAPGDETFYGIIHIACRYFHASAPFSKLEIILCVFTENNFVNALILQSRDGKLEIILCGFLQKMISLKHLSCAAGLVN